VLERLEKLAALSVARGVGFAGLAIVCMMIGFAGHLPAFLKAGGIGFLLVTAVLILKAQVAPATAYKRTELWLMLEEHERPPGELAQRLIATARQNALYRFAYIAAFTSAVFLGSSAVTLVLARA
jgi:hypothetical protein